MYSRAGWVKYVFVYPRKSQFNSVQVYAALLKKVARQESRISGDAGFDKLLNGRDNLGLPGAQRLIFMRIGKWFLKRVLVPLERLPVRTP